MVLTGSGRAFCVGQDLKEHLAGPARRRERPALGDRRGALQPDRAGAGRPCPSRWSRRSTGSPPAPAPAWPSPPTSGCSPTRPAFNTSFAGVALSCDTGASWTLPRLVGRGTAMELLYFPRTVPAAGGPRARPGHPGGPRRRPRRHRRASWRRGWPRGRPSPTARSARPSSTPRRTPSRSRWPSRPKDGPHRRHRGPPRRRRRVHGQGEADLPRPLSGTSGRVARRSRPVRPSARSGSARSAVRRARRAAGAAPRRPSGGAGGGRRTRW